MLSANSSKLYSRRLRRVAIGILGAGIVAIASLSALDAATPPVTRFVGPTSSQPLALTADGAFLVVANPDNNTVSFFDVRGDKNRKLAEVPVQTEPWGVAFLPNGRKAYVANTVSGTVSMIRTNIRNGIIHKPKHITVGTEPYGLALTPNGTRLYVTNARSNSITVINTANDQIVETITNVGFEPRGLAITNDGDDDDTDEKVYVTQFLSLPTPGKVDGFDDAKNGFVTVIATMDNSITGQATINPIADTGFLANGDALGASTGGVRTPPGPDFTFPTGAYPNQLNNIAIKGNYAYIPNTGASPNGPVRFDVNTHSLLSVINRNTNVDAGTLNMHTAVRDQTATPKRFLTMPWAIAFKYGSNEGYVVTASSDVMIKVEIDGARLAQRPVRSIATAGRSRPGDSGGQEPSRNRGEPGRHARLRDELRFAQRDGHRFDQLAHRERARDAAVRGVAHARYPGRHHPHRQGAVQHLGGHIRSSAQHHHTDHRTHVQQRLGLLRRLSHALRYHG